MQLDKELELYGVSMEPKRFKELLGDLHINMHRAWTEEQLLYHPQDAIIFCHAVRHRCGPGLPDEMILRALNNLRKAVNSPSTNGKKAKAKTKAK